MSNNREMDELLLKRTLWSTESHVYENTSNTKCQKEVYKSVNNDYLWMTELRVILIYIFPIFSAANIFLY